MRKPPIRWIVIAVAVLLIGGLVGRAIWSRKAQQAEVAAASTAKVQSVVELAPSDVVKADTRELAQGLPISGSLKAVNSAVVKAKAAGELQGLTVREGDIVKAGQVIARVDATEYQARVAQAQQQADSAKSQVDIAQRQYDNNKALVDQGFISKTALDTSLNNLSAAQATHKAALAAVDVARKTLDDTVLRAPISGVVSQRLAQPGERVAIDGKVVEIVDLGRLELEATLSAGESIDVRVGQEAVLRIEGSTRGRRESGPHQPERAGRQPQRAGLSGPRRRERLAPGPLRSGHARDRPDVGAGRAALDRAHRQAFALRAGGRKRQGRAQAGRDGRARRGRQ
jgi:multidrug efflux pump subunit AcrA (membrane-fusion protein)